MTVVAVASVKGAPGVTTAALALAAVWPAHRRVLVVESDPAGGDIAARFGLGGDSGLVGLATSLRHERAALAGVALGEHCEVLANGVPVLTAPISPTETTAAIGIVADALPRLATEADCDVLIDCGRVLGQAPDAPAAGARPPKGATERLLVAADTVLLLSAAELADLGHVQALLSHLRVINAAVALVLRQPQVWAEAEIERVLDVTVAGTLPTDAVAADVLAGRRQARHTGRLPLFRTAAGIAARLGGQPQVGQAASTTAEEVTAPALLAEGAVAP